MLLRLGERFADILEHEINGHTTLLISPVSAFFGGL